MPINDASLRAVVHECIDGLIQVYYDPQLYPEAKDATNEASRLKDQIDSLPHSTLLAVFFLLLNADSVLKSRIAQRESNTRKLTRFMLDLNKYAVIPFLNTDDISLADFVYRCEELHILA